MRFKGHEITIRWFLGWCRRQRPLVEPTREAARRFYLEKVRERNAAGWQKSGWGAALLFERKQFDWSETVRATVRRRVPVILTVEEVRALLGKLEETTQIYTHVMQKPGLGVRSPLDV